MLDSGHINRDSPESSHFGSRLSLFNFGLTCKGSLNRLSRFYRDVFMRSSLRTWFCRIHYGYRHCAVSLCILVGQQVAMMLVINKVVGFDIKRDASSFLTVAVDD